MILLIVKKNTYKENISKLPNERPEWLPDKTVKRCVKCKEEFKIFSKKKIIVEVVEISFAMIVAVIG